MNTTKLTLLIPALALLTGCVAVPATSGYYTDSAGYYGPAPAYVAPAQVYMAPPPVYLNRRPYFSVRASSSGRTPAAATTADRAIPVTAPVAAPIAAPTAATAAIEALTPDHSGERWGRCR